MASTIKVNFIGDNRDLNRAIDDSDGKLHRFGGSIGSFAKTAGIALGGAAVVGGAALLSMANAAAEDEKAAAALAQTLKNVTGATDASTKQVEDWISAQGKAFGVADDNLRPALDALVRGTGDVTKAQKLASLAMDISAGTGKDLTTVSEALAKAYNGQLGPLKKLDPALAGLVKEGASADEVFAALGKTFEGQAGAAAQTTAGKLQIAKLQFSEMREEIGAKVIPVLASLATWVNTSVLPALERFGGWLGEVMPPIINAVRSWIEDSLIPALKSFAGWVNENVVPALQAFGEWLAEHIPPALEAVSKFINEKVVPAIKDFAGWIDENLMPALEDLWKSFEENILPILQTLAEFIRDKVLPVLAQIAEWIYTYVLPVVGELVTFVIGDLIPALFEINAAIAEVIGWFIQLGEKIAGIAVDIINDVGAVLQFFRDLPGLLADAGEGMFDFIKDAFRSAVNFVIDGWNGLEFKIPGFDPPGPGPSFGGFTLGVPDIPRLAKGGIVSSPTLALIGESGPEAVVPLGRSMGATINFYGPVYGFDDFERKVADVQEKYGLRNGRAA